MKSIISAAVVFLFCFRNSQKPRDSMREIRREMKIQQEDLKKCNDLKDDFKDVSFKSLEELISNKITFRNIKNIIINYRPPFSKYTMINVIPYDYTPIYCNYRNPAYNQSDFWNEKTVKYIHSKYNINLIPYLPDKGEFINQETVKVNMDRKDKAILVFLKQKKTEISGHFNSDEETKYAFFPAKGSRGRKLNLSKKSYQEFEINFRNYIGKIITVRYEYDEDRVVYETYQFVNKTWIEIDTKDEYKF